MVLFQLTKKNPPPTFHYLKQKPRAGFWGWEETPSLKGAAEINTSQQKNLQKHQDFLTAPSPTVRSLSLIYK